MSPEQASLEISKLRSERNALLRQLNARRLEIRAEYAAKIRDIKVQVPPVVVRQYREDSPSDEKRKCPICREELMPATLNNIWLAHDRADSEIKESYPEKGWVSRREGGGRIGAIQRKLDTMRNGPCCHSCKDTGGEVHSYLCYLQDVIVTA